MYVGYCQLTIADKILLLHIWDIEAPHVSRGHALGEGSQAPPGSEPIREPGKVTVTVEVVGVQTAEERWRKRSHYVIHFKLKFDYFTSNV